jgi:hypothetical protein
VYMVFSYKETTEAFHLYRFRDSVVSSSLFIRTWRAPEPLPKNIKLEVRHKGDYISANVGSTHTYEHDNGIRWEKIVWNMKLRAEHTATVRYDAEGFKNKPLNSIYLPYSTCMVGDRLAENIQIVIEWV